MTSAMRRGERRTAYLTTYIMHFNESPDPGYNNWNTGANGKAHLDRERFAAEIGIRTISPSFITGRMKPKQP